MKHDFSRLFRLSNKTGDRLIVYNEVSGEHLVILSIGDYERLYDMASMETMDEMYDSEYDADDELDFNGEWDASDASLSDENTAEPPAFMPQAALGTDIGWYRAGDVLKDTGVPEDAVPPHPYEEEEPAGPYDAASVQSVQEKRAPALPQEFNYEFVGDGPRAVPHKKHAPLESLNEKELQDDEPIFFEEPVE